MKVELHKNIIHFKEVNSTNETARKYLKENKLQDDFVITADFQSSGKGQLLNSWNSEPGKNLLISMVINVDIKLKNQFYLNIVSSLSVLDVLEKYNFKNSSIKWPNDILINKKKVGGILIQNFVKHDIISQTIIGLGLNINQTDFANYNRKATSFCLESNSSYSVKEIRDEFLNKITKRLSMSEEKNSDNYFSCLYLKDKASTFEVDNSIKMGIIRSVSKEGFLVVEFEDATEKFKLQEIKYLS